MTNAELRVPTLRALTELLRPLGYRKSAGLFTRMTLDVVHLVEVQGSRNSNAGRARFTVNVGVFVPALIYVDVREAIKPSIPLAHWRERLGAMSSEREEIWWNAGTQQEAEVAAQDIAVRVQRYALPALAKLLQSQSLAELWQSGSSPGLTEPQRKDFLARLVHNANGKPGAA